LHTKYLLFVCWFSTYFWSTPCWKSKRIHPSYSSCLSYDFSLNYGEIWAQSNDSLGYGIRMDVPEKLLKKMDIVCFVQFSFVFSCVEKIKDNLMLWCLSFDFSLKLKESICVENQSESYLQYYEVLLICLWAMEKLMASAFNNLTDFLLTFTIFVLLSSFLPTNQRLYQFLATIYHSQPTFLPITCWFDSWLIGIWIFCYILRYWLPSHIVAPLVSETTTLVGHK
jgi:hypothetical protein